jgi:hypothetical protein
LITFDEKVEPGLFNSSNREWIDMEFLKAYSHTEETSKSLRAPMQCSEVTFHASPVMLREIADFLIKCAETSENGKVGTPDHFHLRDSLKGWTENYPDVVVFKADMGADN